jgi:MYXO-CTERM domain-containing protein
MAAKFGGFSRGLAAFGAFFALLVLTHQAYAAGGFKLKTTSASETGGQWHIFVTVELPRVPATAHVPMKFLFTKEAVFERDLVDNHGDTPVTNQMVLTNQTPSVESVDVDFADGSGKIYKGTRFDFSLSRDRGYEAGIYQVKVRTSDGLDIGGSQRLTLNGDNPVVDRRSITFNAKERSVKKVPGYGVDGGGANGAPSSDDSTSTQSTDVAPSGSAASFIPADAYNKTPEEEVKTRPSGCGCVVAGASANEEATMAGFGALALGLAAVWCRPRRRRAASVPSASRRRRGT